MNRTPIQHVLVEVAAAFGLEVADLTGPSRQRYIAEARQAAAWVLRKRCPSLSLAAIGAALGHRNHTTIIHAIRAVEARLAHDRPMRRMLETLAEGDLFETLSPVDAAQARADAQAMIFWSSCGRTSWYVAAA